MIKNKYIWIVCEYNQYDTPEVLQLLHKANELKEQSNSKVWIICIGEYQEEAFYVLQEYGATDVLYEPLGLWDLKSYFSILEQMIREYEPELLIFTDKQNSKLIAAKLSNRFDVGLTADCIDILVDEKEEYVFSRTAINGSVIANIKCVQSKICICTVKSNVFPENRVECKKKIEVHRLLNISKFNPENEYITVLERRGNKIEKASDVTNAKIVFSVGRGIQNKETFELINNLANYWNAGIVGTRAAVEEGWIDKSRQIGQSGLSIAPTIYVAFGVSGAIQHMIGVKKAKLIIAINKDPTAPIFDYADYGIVEDINEIVQEMNKQV